MLKNIYNYGYYYIMGYELIKCNKCNKDMYVLKKNYVKSLQYYCSNTCGFSDLI
jgi:hypothetical protein